MSTQRRSRYEWPTVEARLYGPSLVQFPPAGLQQFLQKAIRTHCILPHLSTWPPTQPLVPPARAYGLHIDRT